MSEEARLEERLNWLRSLTQSDRDFISRYGEAMWQKWKANEEFKSIQVEESKHKKESTQARKTRLLDKIEQEQKKLGDASDLDIEILEAWSATGFFEVMASVWDAMFEAMHSTSDKPPNRLTFCLAWQPTEKNEYRVNMCVVAEPIRREIEKWIAEKEAKERSQT